MENPIKKTKVSRPLIAKRIRGLKSKMKLNKSFHNLKRIKKKISRKTFDMNYYLESKIKILLSEEENSINRLRKKEDSEFSEKINSDFEHYKKRDREIAIIGLKDMIYKIIKFSEEEKNKNKEREKEEKILIPENFESSVISLFDYYLKHVKKPLSKSEMIKAIFSSLMFIDREKNMRVFKQYFLKDFELNLDFLYDIDLNIYPVKVFDYFEIFFLRISQINKTDKSHQKYLKAFKEAFIQFDFYLNFNDNSKIYKPYEKFIYLLLMTKDYLKYNNLLEDEIVDILIEKYKDKIIYNHFNYQSCIYFVNESTYAYDNYMDSYNVNI